MFSELGELLEPKRRAISSELLAAIQLARSWIRTGFKLPTGETPDAGVTDSEIIQEYGTGKPLCFDQSLDLLLRQSFMLS
jgi:hypothetical protein